VDRIQSLRLFVRVAERGSFSAVAREFSSSHSAVSQQIGDLEVELNTQLLKRTTRGSSLTEAGSIFYQRAKLIVQQYDSALDEMGGLRNRLSGVVRLASPIMFGRKYIAPALTVFHQLYPDLTVEHHLNDTDFSADTEHDLVGDGIDVAVRIGELGATPQVRQLGSSPLVTIASPGLLEKRGVPLHPADLRNFPCLIFLRGPTPFEWKFVGADRKPVFVQVDGPYRANVYEAAYEAALAGLGVLIAPLSACGEDIRLAKLQRILPEYELPEVSIHAVFPAPTVVSHQSKLLVEFLANEFKRMRWIDTKSNKPELNSAT
jgi:DNA-binding transcriptional LysR family regulator